MKGTRLWQNTGSPLISGSSRRERPFLQQALLGWLGAVVAVIIAVFVLAEALDLPRLAVPVAGISGTLAVLTGSLAYAAVPSLIGSLFGVWLARNMGWTRPWAVGAALGILAAFLWLALSVTPT